MKKQPIVFVNCLSYWAKRNKKEKQNQLLILNDVILNCYNCSFNDPSLVRIAQDSSLLSAVDVDVTTTVEYDIKNTISCGRVSQQNPDVMSATKSTTKGNTNSIHIIQLLLLLFLVLSHKRMLSNIIISNIPINDYCFVVHTSIIIYYNQQQQKEEKERGMILALFPLFDQTVYN